MIIIIIIFIFDEVRINDDEELQLALAAMSGSVYKLRLRLGANKTGQTGVGGVHKKTTTSISVHDEAERQRQSNERLEETISDLAKAVKTVLMKVDSLEKDQKNHEVSLAQRVENLAQRILNLETTVKTLASGS